MKSLRAALIAAFACFVISAHARPEPNAFLNRIANSPTELTSMVKKDGQVRDRYMRHFAMTQDEVTRYLGGLQLTKLTSDQLFVVYAAPDSGVLRSKTLRVKKGTKVWVDSANRVTLLWHCGNPVTRGPQKTLAMGEVGAEIEGLEEEIFESAPLRTPESQMDAARMDLSEPAVPDIPYVSVMPGESDIQIAPPIPGLTVPTWLVGIPPLILISNPPNNPPPPPVPEPGTIAALAIGAAALIRKRKKN